jgi:hypothetical protein
MSKFQRTYEIRVQGRSGAEHVISYPLTCIFDLQRRATGSANTGHFMVYNLSAAVRNDLQHDIAFDADQLRTFTFRAGYESEGYMPVLYRGTLQTALSYREGPDIVTDFVVLDGGQTILNAQLERTRSGEWDPRVEVEQIVKQLAPYGVTLGAVGTLFNGYTPSRGVTWIGSTWDILKKFASSKGGYAFIDMQKVYLLSNDDVLVAPGALPKLDASTGLIGTPRRTGWVVDARMIFEPRVTLMQKIVIESLVNPNINGTYGIQAIGHQGVISGSKDGGVITSLNLTGNPVEWNEVVPQ